MTTHPYVSLADQAFWRRSVAEVAPGDIDPVVSAPWRISPSDLVATAGSCFAQHLARRLRASGYTHLVTETPHPLLAPQADEFNYGVYSARYGNIYTPRQLLQLVHRATSRFAPQDDVWKMPDGSLRDPFRPQIQPGGFASRDEYDADREKHFVSVRRALEELDVMIFTLGLTEAWRSKVDGAVYPICPGVAGGSFDPNVHQFHNFTIEEIVADIDAFVDELRAVNPTARLILTVSPVPLVATASGKHVLEATVYSKSVLRVACTEIERKRSDVVYFPSYEIVAGSQTAGTYFAEDRRSVTEAGVDHVMRVFMRHFTEGTAAATPAASPGDSHSEEMEKLVRANCDEIALDR